MGMRPAYPGNQGQWRRGARWLAGAVILAIAVAFLVVTTRKAPTAVHTITYSVTGSDATVTYGPAGSSASGSVPMSETAAIPSSPPVYYAITAQLNGSGSVTCEILVDGTVVSTSTAAGSYNIASCEIVQDPLTGQWQDANSGA
jgi:hypothetical protein